jgi:hypothetical protein
VHRIERANGLYGKWLAGASKHRVGNGNDVTAFLEDSQCLDGSALLLGCQASADPGADDRPGCFRERQRGGYAPSLCSNRLARRRIPFEERR